MRVGTLILGLAVVGGFAIFFSMPNMSGASKAEAQKQAKAWAAEMQLEPKAIVCAGTDSDNDGYVSCTFNMPDGKILSFECAGAMNMNEGCRKPKMNLLGG